MLDTTRTIYWATRKKHDQLWNIYVMRPLAAAVVAVLAPTGLTPNQLTLVSLFIFVATAGVLVAAPLGGGTTALVAAAVLELSYLFDCADGMLARHKKLASKQGHLFDFFTDELKAVLLMVGASFYLYRFGGLGLDATRWAASDPRFLMAGIAAVGVIASGTSLTNFVRRPEISGQETPVSAHYETVQEEKPRSPLKWAAGQVFTFLRFLNHYPSHFWLFAALGALDAFFWVYLAINLLYLARGWLGLIVRFGRAGSSGG